MCRPSTGGKSNTASNSQKLTAQYKPELGPWPGKQQARNDQGQGYLLVVKEG